MAADAALKDFSNVASGAISNDKLAIIQNDKLAIIQNDKLAAIAPSKITQDASNRFVTDEEKGDWNGAMQGYNYIINGNFDIWQRGTSQSVSGYGSDDRWLNGAGGATIVHSKQPFAVGELFPDGEPCPTNYSRTIVSSVVGVNNTANKLQKIESVKTLAGKKAVLSFYGKANAAKNVAIEFAQDFGTGGSPSSNVVGIGVQKIALTTVWQRFTVVVDIPNINGKVLGTNGNDSLCATLWFDAGSTYDVRTNSLGHQSGTFDIACIPCGR